MRILGSQFVLGRTIEEATDIARKAEGQGYRLLLRHAGRSGAHRGRRQALPRGLCRGDRGASRRAAQRQACATIPVSRSSSRRSIRATSSPSASRVMNELVERALALAVMARGANMGFNIDAEEADRLDLSLDVIDAVLGDPAPRRLGRFRRRCAGLRPARRPRHRLGRSAGRKARPPRHGAAGQGRLLGRRDQARAGARPRRLSGVHPQGRDRRQLHRQCAQAARKARPHLSAVCDAQRTHCRRRAASGATSSGPSTTQFEFQRLHGMGERLHEILRDEHGTKTRIYAPVGRHADLLAYLVRRLLENGANGSFVNMIADREVPAAQVARDPFDDSDSGAESPVRCPADLFAPARRNSRGLDVTDPLAIERARSPPATPSATRTGRRRRSTPCTGDDAERFRIDSPATGELVGEAIGAGPQTVEAAIAAATAAAARLGRPIGRRPRRRSSAAPRTSTKPTPPSSSCSAPARPARRSATPSAKCAKRSTSSATTPARPSACATRTPLGIVTCISPWNFPLAIFTGQIAAALVAGNAVLAKPAETTPLIAARAVAAAARGRHPARCPATAAGRGQRPSARRSPPIRASAASCFTGSLRHRQGDRPRHGRQPRARRAADRRDRRPQRHDRRLDRAARAGSTRHPRLGLPVAPASAARRYACSTSRRTPPTRIIEMLLGAMDELAVGDPAVLATDIGPVIDDRGQDEDRCPHRRAIAARGAVLKQLADADRRHLRRARRAQGVRHRAT